MLHEIRSFGVNMPHCQDPLWSIGEPKYVEMFGEHFRMQVNASNHQEQKTDLDRFNTLHAPLCLMLYLASFLLLQASLLHHTSMPHKHTQPLSNA